MKTFNKTIGSVPILRNHRRGKKGFLKCMCMIIGEGSWPYDVISKYFFLQSKIVEKVEDNNYLLYIFVITIWEKCNHVICEHSLLWHYKEV